MISADNTYKLIEQSILERYDLNWDKTLKDVYELHSGFLQIEPVVKFSFEHRESILEVLNQSETFNSILNLFVTKTLEFTYNSNQFINMGDEGKKELTRIYTLHLLNIKSVLEKELTYKELEHQINFLMAEHFQRLRDNIIRYFDNEVTSDVYENVILKNAVCEEYSPVFQIKILGIDLNNIENPILDIGCGKSGGLVKYLIDHGYEAVGIDRIVDKEKFLVEADWLTFNYDCRKWGTIISQMSFTNHFIFNHLYKKGVPENYAQTYRKIIDSLSVNGSFYYTPALPFIEKYLQSEKFFISYNRFEQTIKPVHKSGVIIEDDGHYSVKVTKIS